MSLLIQFSNYLLYNIEKDSLRIDFSTLINVFVTLISIPLEIYNDFSLEISNFLTIF